MAAGVAVVDELDISAQLTNEEIMLPLTRHGLAANYNDAAALTKRHSPQDHFSAHYEQTPDWAIGPFDRDSSLTFTPSSQWPDPTGIGWTASAIFNPSLIRHDGRLVVFYRAAPSMESTASRIGMAVHDPATGWTDSPRNPLIYPTTDNELHGCEDPKIYRANGRYFLFYNAVFPIDPDDARRYPSPNYTLEDIGCDINVAVSDDLVNWTKIGPIVHTRSPDCGAKALSSRVTRTAMLFGSAVNSSCICPRDAMEPCASVGRWTSFTGSSKSSNTSTSNR